MSRHRRALILDQNYCLLIIVNFAIEIMACASFLQFWLKVDSYILMAIVLAALILVNCFAVKGFGEVEYWLALVKILAIIFFLCVGVYVLIRTKPGVSNYEKAGGPFLGVSTASAFWNTIGLSFRTGLFYTLQNRSSVRALPLEVPKWSESRLGRLRIRESLSREQSTALSGVS